MESLLVESDLDVSKQGACLEANFALDKKTPLRLFDCLLPAIPQQSQKEEAGDIYLERALEKKVDQQKKELKIVDWYIEILEGGRDTKEIVKSFS